MGMRTLLLSTVCFFSASTLAFAEKKVDNKAVAKKPVKEAAKKDKGKKSMSTVVFETSMGTIKIELDKEKAPKTVENFLGYVNSGHYNKTIFHRVIKGFMIQGGGMDENMKEKSTRAPIENEGKNGLKNEIGTIAMARTSAPNSATAQFFINTANNDFLNAGPGNPGYAVFGKVVEGMDVVEKIGGVKTGNKGMHSDVPVTPVVIESAHIAK